MKNTLLSLLIVCAGPMLLSASNFKDFSRKIVSLQGRPKAAVRVTSLYVIHPLVKDKETILEHKFTLRWQGAACKRTITAFRKIKGTARMRVNANIGNTHAYSYPPKKLIQLCTVAAISQWKADSSLRLEKKSYKGYRFKAALDGIRRDAIIYLDARGAIKAVSLGLPEGGITGTAGNRDTGTVWYFGHGPKGLRLVRIYRLTAQKKRGIPLLKKVEIRFSRF